VTRRAWERYQREYFPSFTTVSFLPAHIAELEAKIEDLAGNPASTEQRNLIQALLAALGAAKALKADGYPVPPLIPLNLLDPAKGALAAHVFTKK
jgi:hypothetical protein